MYLKKFVPAIFFIFVIALCFEAAAQDQQPQPAAQGVDGFVGHGIARISGGDMSGARQNALADAQLKAIVDGAFSLLPADAAAAQSSRLFSHFASRPERFLQSYRIVSEHALPDQYQVAVQASLDMDGLRQDLAALGLVKAAAGKAATVLVMASERGLDDAQDIFWWSPDAGADPGGFQMQQLLDAAFADTETRVLSPFDPPLKELFGPVGSQPDPDPASVARLALQTEAQTVIIARSSLRRVRSMASSVQSVQCDISARALDVRRGEVMAQAAVCGLGMHVDEQSAGREAMQKAARQLADQITDRMYQQLRQAREYVFKLRFNRPVSDADARDCISAFKTVLPGLELVDISGDAGAPERWSARVTSPAESAADLQKMFGSGVAGYVTKITSVQDNVLSLRVTPIKK